MITRLSLLVLMMTLASCQLGPRVSLRTGALYPTLGPDGQCRLSGPDYVPERGHVVAVTIDGLRTVRRIIGLAGDKIEVRRGVLTINGAKARQQVLKKLTVCSGGMSSRCRCQITEEEVGSRTFSVQTLIRIPGLDDARCVRSPDGRPVTVPDKHVFLMADNRDGAVDSRTLGPLPQSRIEARVLGCK